MAHEDRTTQAVEAAPAETGEQREAVPVGAGEGSVEAPAGEGEATTTKQVWAGHPFDIRLRIWTPFGPRYLVLLGGREHRPSDRRREERKRHPLWTLYNVLVGTVITVILLLVGNLALAAALYLYLKVIGI